LERLFRNIDMHRLKIWTRCNNYFKERMQLDKHHTSMLVHKINRNQLLILLCVSNLIERWALDEFYSQVEGTQEQPQQVPNLNSPTNPPLQQTPLQ